MRDPWEILDTLAEQRPGLAAWLHRARSVREAYEVGRVTGATPDGIFKYASLLWPRFLELNGYVLRYEARPERIKESWAHWCKWLAPRFVAEMMNRVRVENLYVLRKDDDLRAHVDEVGELIAFFWRVAVERQFPNAGVHVRYQDGAIDIWQDPTQTEQQGAQTRGDR